MRNKKRMGNPFRKGTQDDWRQIAQLLNQLIEAINDRFPDMQPDPSALPLIITPQRFNAVKRFIAECCVVSPEAKVTRAELYQAWKSWTEVNEEFRSVTDETFGRDLRAIIPRLGDARYRMGPERTPIRHYLGIGILQPSNHPDKEPE